MLVIRIVHIGDFEVDGPLELENKVFGPPDDEPESEEDSLSVADTETLGIQDEDDTASRSNTSGRHSSLNSNISLPSHLVSRPTHPSYYIFEGDVLHVRDLGVPELSPSFQASFQEEPDWLDDKDPFVLNGKQVPTGHGVVTEKMDGFKLFQTRSCEMGYLQLPEGVTLPYVDEADSS